MAEDPQTQRSGKVLSISQEERPERISYTHPVSLGGCLLESLDDITGALARCRRGRRLEVILVEANLLGSPVAAGS
jgi:hypothetical protein